jgi:hypothetical protein
MFDGRGSLTRGVLLRRICAWLVAVGLLSWGGSSLAGLSSRPTESPRQVEQRAEKLYKALKRSPIPNSGLPADFRFGFLRTHWFTAPHSYFEGDVYEVLRGPDSFDLVFYDLLWNERGAKQEMTPGPGSTFLYPPIRARPTVGFGSQAVAFDRVERLYSKKDCGRSVRSCAIAGVVVRRGSILVFAVTGRANQDAGDDARALELAKSAVTYLTAVEKKATS